MAELAAHPTRVLLLLIAGLAGVVALLAAWWPLGVAIGALAGIATVLVLGRAQQAEAERVPHDGALSFIERFIEPEAEFIESEPDPEPEPENAYVRSDLAALKARLGDTYPDYARAATFVVATQYASAARLQRELHVPYARARALLDDLESQRLVGPSTGPVPRQVLLPRDHLAELELLLRSA